LSATGEKRRFMKAVRSTVRLKWSLRADEELEEVLPKYEKRYDAAVASGKGYEFATSSILLELERASES
jgi:hypothetical protein